MCCMLVSSSADLTIELCGCNNGADKSYVCDIGIINIIRERYVIISSAIFVDM